MTFPGGGPSGPPLMGAHCPVGATGPMGPAGPAPGRRRSYPGSREPVGEADLVPGRGPVRVRISAWAMASYVVGEPGLAPAADGVVHVDLPWRNDGTTVDWRRCATEEGAASVLSSLDPFVDEDGEPLPGAEGLVDREDPLEEQLPGVGPVRVPGGGWPPEALALLVRASRRAAVFELACLTAVVYAPLVGPLGVSEAARISAVVEVMSS